MKMFSKVKQIAQTISFSQHGLKKVAFFSLRLVFALNSELFRQIFENYSVP